MYFSKKNVVPIVGFGFSQMWKNQYCSGGYVSYHSYSEKAVPAVRKSCDNYHETVVTIVIRQLFAMGKSKTVRWVISDCWRGHSAFTLWIWLKNGKISLKGILLF